MTFSLHLGVVVISSEITHVQLSKIHALPIYYAPALISSNANFIVYSLPQPHHATTSHPSPGDKPPECGRAVQKTTGTKQI